MACLLSGIINPFLNKPLFLRVCCSSPLKTLWEEKKFLVTSNFSFSHSIFYLFQELSAIFNKLVNVVCKLSVWKSPKFVISERVKMHQIPFCQSLALVKFIHLFKQDEKKKDCMSKCMNASSCCYMDQSRNGRQSFWMIKTGSSSLCQPYKNVWIINDFCNEIDCLNLWCLKKTLK